MDAAWGNGIDAAGYRKELRTDKGRACHPRHVPGHAARDEAADEAEAYEETDIAAAERGCQHVTEVVIGVFE